MYSAKNYYVVCNEIFYLTGFCYCSKSCQLQLQFFNVHIINLNVSMPRRELLRVFLKWFIFNS